ncbi:MAG: zinc ribbon domain-containing protein [Gemmatimonadales bacterium]
MASKTTRCPSCGADAEGKFCRHCGASLGPRTCGSCHAPLAAGAKFCTQCGTPSGGGAPAGQGASAAAPGDRKAWGVAAAVCAVLLVAVLALVVRGSGGAPEAAGAVGAGGAVAPFAGGSGDGTPPDLSTMTPREQFDRLYNRIMRAAESGDQQTVTQFTPMALVAYERLEIIDADARFHLATLKLHSGDVAGASAIADTLLMKDPGHLFGYVIQGTVARWNKDDAALKKAYKDFLSHYDAEMKKGRPEYGDHERMMTDFQQAATAGQ